MFNVYANFHQDKYIGSSVIVYTNFLPYLAKNRKIRSCDLDLSPVTLKFNRIRAAVKVRVRANFHQDKYSGSSVIVYTNFLPYLAMINTINVRVYKESENTARDLEI